MIVFQVDFCRLTLQKNKAPAKQTNIAWQTFWIACLYVWSQRQTLLDKDILLVNVFEIFQNEMIVFQVDFCRLTLQKNKAPAKQTNIAWQTFWIACLYVWPQRQTLLDKDILLVNVFETFQNEMIVFQVDFCRLTLQKNKAPAKQTNIAWQTFWILLVKHACTFGHNDKHCLTRTFCLSMFLKLFKNIFCLSEAKNVCLACACVVAKPTNVVLDKQNFKCLPNNVCPFGRGLRFYSHGVFQSSVSFACSWAAHDIVKGLSTFFYIEAFYSSMKQTKNYSGDRKIYLSEKSPSCRKVYLNEKERLKTMKSFLFNEKKTYKNQEKFFTLRFTFTQSYSVTTE